MDSRHDLGYIKTKLMVFEVIEYLHIKKNKILERDKLGWISVINYFRQGKQ